MILDITAWVRVLQELTTLASCDQSQNWAGQVLANLQRQITMAYLSSSDIVRWDLLTDLAALDLPLGIATSATGSSAISARLTPRSMPPRGRTWCGEFCPGLLVLFGGRFRSESSPLDRSKKAEKHEFVISYAKRRLLCRIKRWPCSLAAAVWDFVFRNTQSHRYNFWILSFK